MAGEEVAGLGVDRHSPLPKLVTIIDPTAEFASAINMALSQVVVSDPRGSVDFWAATAK
jgi:hypothetical protein